MVTKAEWAFMVRFGGLISRIKIPKFVLLLKSEATTMKSETFRKFVEDVQKDSESLLLETDDVPNELLNDKNLYKNMLQNLSQHTNMLATVLEDEVLDVNELENMTRIAARARS
ncbi:MAG: hypothetical protein EBS53_01305 [Bacteroidetes bacterium]|nr:hypothetical protein [Bacteroidota bacterium]